MKARGRQPIRLGVFALAAIWMFVIVPLSAAAAPYAAMVMDARSGEVLHARNADTRLHPASLTKMMTLYVAFEAIENGEIGLDDMVKISRHAANEPPSKLGLKAGSSIKLRFLIRAAAVKSANDASTAIAEAISGSEAAFARRMNRTAKALGMSRTTFKNAHGLTEAGHLSTARDMTVMGRHVFYDYPQYYNLFSRIEANAGVRTVLHTNRRLLNSYRGADGIKTGYTRAAGFNLVASAERGQERIIATVFGGRSTNTRNARVAELLDMGFKRAPTRVALNRPVKPVYQGPGTRDVAAPDTQVATSGAAGRTVRLISAAAVKKSLRPQSRPASEVPVLVANQTDIERALREAKEAGIDLAVLEPATSAEAIVEAYETPAVTPAEPSTPPEEIILASVAPTVALKPQRRPQDLIDAKIVTADPVQEVVTRISTSGGHDWGINVGRYPSQYKARKVLLTTALSEMGTLDGSLRKVVKRAGGFDANFMGMTREGADRACRRLAAKKFTCFMIEPG
ncbi:D-alanyl-D-alanine carboxypeptidase [Roseovarius sp. LXJ103]|uniref:D-alanyl-D-alanine carboxypeptidase family protein n=1 Tax=Roseovarius carneus TaxID=2853164 RepID=UPI000D60F012|nr:D-alanyl-D-alanine carboxypeptidase family protein [Roseovarius carneus]MBZ8117341.1 D-alanyl-D-alanine carboxypeptidase [Roseovarius carneus]PWE36838.1 D-alanyl-D-alanine carboxypeptidase [Pelagicola sp. LXJ1103]